MCGSHVSWDHTNNHHSPNHAILMAHLCVSRVIFKFGNLRFSRHKSSYVNQLYKTSYKYGNIIKIYIHFDFKSGEGRRLIRGHGSGQLWDRPWFPYHLDTGSDL